MEGKFYTIEKKNGIATPFYELVSGIAATPPLNTWQDVLAPAGEGVFYRIKEFDR